MSKHLYGATTLWHVTRRSEATRRRLIAAARELIASEGLDISLSEVAERAGVTRMTLYRHFGPRRELLLEVLLDDVAPVAETAGTLLADPALPLADRAHRAMSHATVSLSATPLLLGVLGDAGVGAGAGLSDIDPSGALRGLLTSAIGPFLREAEEAGILRGTPEEALSWVTRQVVAGVVGRGSGADSALVSRQVALFFVPSLLRVDVADCERLAATGWDATSASADAARRTRPGDPVGDGAAPS